MSLPAGPILLLAIALAGPPTQSKSATARSHASPSTRFPPPPVMPWHVNTRQPPRTQAMPPRAARSAGCCRHGSSGTPRTRRMNAPPSWRHPTSTGAISTRSCCSGWRATTRRRALCAARLPPNRTICPARLRLAEVLFDAGDLAAERTAVRPVDGDRRDGAGGGSGTGPHQRGARARTRRPFATSSGRSHCFPSLAPLTTRWREPTAPPAAPPTPSAPPRRTPATARAGLDSTIPCWPPSPHCVRTHTRSLARGVSLADGGDVRGAVEAHEAALARDPSLTQAHANLVGLYGRLHELAESRGALSCRSRPGLGRCGAALRLWGRARIAGEVGGCGRRVQKGADGQPAARAGQEQPRAGPRTRARFRRRLRTNTVRRWRPGRRSAWRASTSDGCCWFAATPRRRSSSSRSSSSRSMPKRRGISLRYRQRSFARAEWLTDGGSGPRRSALPPNSARRSWRGPSQRSCRS